MTDDPVRLLDEAGSELLRALISAGRAEQPEAAALRRTLAAVGAGLALSSTGLAAGSSAAAGSAVPGAAPGAASSTLVVVVKWLVIGAVIGTLASLAMYGVSGALKPAPSSLSAAPAARSAGGIAGSGDTQRRK